MSFNPFEIGIKISMMNAVSSVLATIAHDVLGVDRQVSHLIEKFKALGNSQKLMLGGGVAMAAGAGLVMMYKDLADHGKDFIRIQHNMQAAGVSQVDIAKSTAEAWRTSFKYMNVNATQALDLADNMRSVFGGQEHANEFLEKGVGFLSFMKAKAGEEGQHNAERVLKEVEAAMISGELRGITTPEAMERVLNNFGAMSLNMGDRFSVQKFLTAQRNAGTSFNASSEDFQNNVFPFLVQEMKGRAGTQLMTTFNKMGAGVGWRGYAIDAAKNLGLVDESVIERNKQGKATRITDPWGIQGHAEYLSNPLTFANDVLAPMVEKAARAKLTEKGQDPGNAAMLKAEMAAQISRIFPDRSAANFFSELILQHSKWLKDAAIQMQAMNAFSAQGGAEGYREHSLDYQEQAFTEQWKNLMTALGSPLVETATNMMMKVNGALQSIADWARQNPDAVKTIGELGLALGVGLATAGLAAFLAGVLALIGPLGIAAAAIAGVLAAIGINTAGQNDTRQPQGMEDPAQASQRANLNKSWLQQVHDTAPQLMDDIGAHIKTFVSYLSGVKEAFIGLGTLDWGRMKAGLSQMGQSFSEAFSNLGKDFTDYATFMKGTVWPKLQAFVADVGNDIGNAMTQIGGKFIAAIEAIPGQVGAAISGMGAAIGAKISSAISGLFGSTPATPQAPSAVRKFPGHAMGGSTHAGEWAIVGENGPELWRSHTDGYVTPSHRLGQANILHPGQGQSQHVVNLTTNHYLDGRKIASTVEQHIVRKGLHPTRAPSFDGMAMWAPPDSQFSTG